LCYKMPMSIDRLQSGRLLRPPRLQGAGFKTYLRVGRPSTKAPLVLKNLEDAPSDEYPPLEDLLSKVDES